MLLCNPINNFGQKREVPLVCQQGILEYFMEHSAINEGRRWLASSLDAVLQNSTSHTPKGVCNNCCGYELIGMQDEKILRVIDNTLSFGGKLANDMDMGTGVGRCVVPGAAKMHSSCQFGVVCFNSEYLSVLVPLLPPTYSVHTFSGRMLLYWSTNSPSHIWVTRYR